MSRKKLLSLLLVMAALVSTVACGGSDQTKSDTTETDSQQKDKVTIRYSLWGDTDRLVYTEKTIAKFEELHSNIDVEVELCEWDEYEDKETQEIEAGTEADVMQLGYGWIQKYSSDGKGFYDLKSLSDIINLDVFTTDELRYGVSANKLNGIPIAMNTSIPVYNQEIYDKYSLDLPETWDDLFKAATAMRKDDIYPLVMDQEQLCSFLFSYYMQVTGDPVYMGSGQLQLNRSAIGKMMDMYNLLLEKKVICPPDEFRDSMLNTGKAAGVMCWISSIENYEKRIEAADGRASLGAFIENEDAETLGYFIKPASLLAISKNTKHPEEAAQLVEYLLNSKENAKLQLLDKGVPCSKSAQMTLMENDDLNNLTYRASIMLDYNIGSMTVKPEKFEDGDFLPKFFDTMDSYYAGEDTFENTALEIKALLRK